LWQAEGGGDQAGTFSTKNWDDRRKQMKQAAFKKSIQSLFKRQEKLLSRRNRKAADGNGIYDRYDYPVLTAAHAPLIWRYDLNPRQIHI
jgi:hypothetical protein